MNQHRIGLFIASLGILCALISLGVVIVLSPLEGILLTLLFTGICGAVYWSVLRPILHDRALQKRGLPASAVILEARDTGTTVNRNPKVDLLLEIRPGDGGASYQARATPVVSRLQAALLQPGTAVEVKIDPRDRKRVALASVSTSGGLSRDPAESRLERLQDLHRKGLITEAEYRRKREEILRGL
ncbi:conserved hypothetical protein [uncultured Desulfatiglans sp.]|uniref:SHOCT domain-containing protein n=1 Tax=Uncultured Desulfatiglans sp. TaxID=1748965 RepID=A0A653AG53_UNCDX|nr:conserved hypothetical protein [uncultured Desulfatiglans sp.]